MEIYYIIFFILGIIFGCLLYRFYEACTKPPGTIEPDSLSMSFMLEAYGSKEEAFKANTGFFLGTEEPMVEYWERSEDDPESEYVKIAIFDSIKNCELYGKMVHTDLDHKNLEAGNVVSAKLNPKFLTHPHKPWVCKIPQKR